VIHLLQIAFINCLFKLDLSVEKYFSEPKKRPSSVVWVRGNKFLMDESGKTMLRVAPSPTSSATMENISLKRIDIGGVTFIQKSSDVLVRTDTHNARNLLR
jgi:hypothetical protein